MRTTENLIVLAKPKFQLKISHLKDPPRLFFIY